ncbi:MAG: ClbS/DfsB family four-helix bundle protein [Anaerolineales bacterium]
MNRGEILAALKDSRARLEAALAGLTETQMAEPGVLGEWSVKDILAHLTAWEVELVTVLGKLQRGQKPGHISWEDDEVEALNAKWYKEYRNRPLDRVLADWRGVRQQTIRQVGALDDKAIHEPRPWFKKRSLFVMIKAETFEHEVEHAAQIEEWQKKE